MAVPVTVSADVASGNCLEWAAAGRALPGEPVSGDLVLHQEVGGGDLLATIDGLGHGAEAADAAARAREIVRGCVGQPIDVILTRAHEALARTRGVAMTIASVRCNGEVDWVGVGNVEAHVIRHGGQRSSRVASAILFGGVLGYRLPTVRTSTVTLLPGDLIMMATDGIDPSFTDEVVVADPLDRLVDGILSRSARPNDDALVLAARYRGPAR
jgi:hypothetical protein